MAIPHGRVRAFHSLPSPWWLDRLPRLSKGARARMPPAAPRRGSTAVVAMPLKMRPTGLGHGVYKDVPDYSVFCGGWCIGRIYQTRTGSGRCTHLASPGRCGPQTKWRRWTKPRRSGAPSGLRPSSLVMCNTPVEVQFTSAGCLNYPCRTPRQPKTTPMRRLCQKSPGPVDVPACMTARITDTRPAALPPTMRSFEVGDGPAEALWRQMGGHCR